MMSETEATVRSEFGLACPQCGRDDDLRICLRSWAAITPEGTECDGDHHWDNKSGCICDHCNHSGTVSDFQVEE